MFGAMCDRVGMLNFFSLSHSLTACLTMSTPSLSPEPSDIPLSHSALINAKLVTIETIAANKRNKKASTKKTSRTSNLHTTSTRHSRIT